MLNEGSIPDTYWNEAIHTIVYTLNQVQLRVNSRMTPYELWYNWKPSVNHFRVFGTKSFIKRDAHGLGSFDSRSDEGIFLAYSTKRKAYKCYNKNLRKKVDIINMRIDEDLHKKNLHQTLY